MARQQPRPTGTDRSLRPGDTVRVDDDAAAAIAKRGPPVGLAPDALRGELAGSQLLIAPEHIALRVLPLGEQPVGQPDGLDGLAVEDRRDPDAGFPGELREQRLGINLVLGHVSDDALGSASLQPPHRGQQQ